MGDAAFGQFRFLRCFKNPVNLLIILTAILGSLFVWMSIRSLTATAPIWVEGPALGTVSAIRSGRLYQVDALNHLPYAVQTHTPLSYWLSAAISTQKITFWPLRLANISFTVAGAILIGFWVAGEASAVGDLRRGAAMFAAITFLLMPAVFLWSQPARFPDSMATFFTLAALLARLRIRDGIWQYALIGVLGACAVLSKQTALFILAGTLASYDLPRSEFLPCFYRVAAMAIMLIIPIAYLQYRTHGGFYQNVVLGNLVKFNYATWFEIAIRFSWMFWLFAIAVLALGSWWKSLGGMYFLVAAGFGLLTCCKMGSDIMYFFDAGAATAIIAGSAVGKIQLRSTKYKWISTSVLAAALMVMVAFGDTPRFRINDPYFSRNYELLIDFVGAPKAASDLILSEDASVPLRLGFKSAI